MTCAVVDDDDDVRKALSRLLQAMGHDVRAFASAEDFEAETVVVDCAIVDVRLPGLNGFELRERLRGRNAAAPVVLISGDGHPLAKDIAPAVGTPLVTKPFDADALARAIALATSTRESA
jgi:two-component system, LuxR family, response regulator FixJ